MNIFKAYDIRGVYPEEINEDWAYRIGRAFALLVQEENDRDDVVIFLSKDNRLSSDSLYEEVKRGMMDQGVKVMLGGLASTPMFYFGVANYGFDAGICVTASHNPGKYNGFKMVKKGAVPVGELSGLKRVEEIARNGVFDEKMLGDCEEISIIDDYVEKNNYFNNYDFKLLIDTANGIAGLPAHRIMRKDNYISIFPELDGSFPNHNPDPLEKGNLDALCRRVIEEEAEIGIAFDGDGDRVFFVDELGKTISCDIVTAIVAEIILRNNPGVKIIYDVRCSNVVKEVIEQNGGIAIMNRVGHTFIKEKMREEGVFFGGEYSGHFYCRESFYAENPFFVISLILDEMKRTGLKFSQILSKYKKYYHSGEMNFRVENKERIINSFKAKYSDGLINEIDGLRVDYDDYWFLLRGSNTEPLLRLIIEAKTEEVLEKRLIELKKLIVE